MFNIGDKVKITVAAVEIEMAEWRGSQAFDNMVSAARDKRFLIVGMDSANYMIKRLEDDQVLSETKSRVEVAFEKADD